MGRHSRSGRENPNETAERAAKHGDIPGPQDTVKQGASLPPQAAADAPAVHSRTHGPAGPRRGASQARPHGSPASEGTHLGPSARGAHPEQRELGGGWGAGPSGKGSASVPNPTPPSGASGRTVRSAPAGSVGTSAPGPREEYLEVFETGTFAVDQAHSGGVGIPAPTRGEDGEDARPPAPVPGARRQEKGGWARTLSGIAAAAVATVLAVTIAAQVTGDGDRESPATATAEIERDEAEDAEARSAEGRAGVPPSASPKTYAEKLAEPIALKRNATASGAFADIGGAAEGPGGAQEHKYRVDVEKGLPVDGKLFAEAVHKTLNDERSWAYRGERSFDRVTSSGRADFVVTLASPGTTDKWCAKSGLDTSEQAVSCDSAATERVMINGYRWARGSHTFGLDRLAEYRQMLINHEVGHRIGLGHVGCSEDGALAPVMMQQTKTLTTGPATCRPNAWPHPDA